MRLWTAVLGIVTLAPLGCSGGGSGVTYTGTVISDYVASWDGYAEAFAFEDGSDRFRLELSTSGNGFIEVGDLPLLDPPTDPNVGYPPAPWDWKRADQIDVGTLVKPGFRYPIYDAHVESARIRFTADYRDVYQSWCAMQTPHLTDMVGTPPVYWCVVDPGNFAWVPSDDGKACTIVDANTGQLLPIDCIQALACAHGVVINGGFASLCTCDATSCSTSVPPIRPIRVDAALEMEGRNLVGTFATEDGFIRFAVRLTRR